MKSDNIYLRLSRCEAVCNQLRREMDDVLAQAYDTACEQQDENAAAAIARKIRNNLLAATDDKCTLDRVLPDAPSGTTFTSWLVWLKALGAIKTNEWGVYRQHLRDITSQQGFPFNIDWGTPPEE